MAQAHTTEFHFFFQQCGECIGPGFLNEAIPRRQTESFQGCHATVTILRDVAGESIFHYRSNVGRVVNIYAEIRAIFFFGAHRFCEKWAKSVSGDDTHGPALIFRGAYFLEEVQKVGGTQLYSHCVLTSGRRSQ